MRQSPDFNSLSEGKTFGDVMMSFVRDNPPKTMNASAKKLLKMMQSLYSFQRAETFISILEDLQDDKSAENANELFRVHIEPILLSYVPQHSHGTQWDYFVNLCETGGVNPLELYRKKYPPKVPLKKKKKGKKK